jgi:monoamine oxidase
VTTYDVAIVGAGFAGLTAARELVRRGKSCVVLEARDRVGGRVYTKTLEDGTWVDLGGQWLGPTQEHALALVRELGLETFPTYTKGKNLLVAGGKTTRYRGTIPPLPLRDLLEVGLAQLRFGLMTKRVPLDAPWKAKRAREWDAQTLRDWLDDNVRSKTTRAILAAGLDSVFAAGADELSLLHALFYVRSGGNLDRLLAIDGGAQATRITGGMQQVAEKLAKGLDVRLSSPVRAIAHDGAGATVRLDDGEVRSRYVVVAVPPKLAAAIVFEPEVPRTELARETPMGAVIKHHAIYERPFWRDDGLSGLVVSDVGPIHVAFDNSAPTGPGILMGFSEAHEARALGKLTEIERRDVAAETFARLYGPRAKTPLAYVDHVWENDEWSGGCYGAFMPRGVWTSLGPRIREPCGRIHWAGTETATVWSGYIDGAIASARRVVLEIMG